MNFSRLRKYTQIRCLRILQRISLPEEVFMFTLAGLVGLFAGLGAYFLNLLIHFVHFVFFEQAAAYFASSLTHKIFLISIPGIGGLLVGLISHFFGKEAKGHGVPSVIESVANRGGFIRPRVSIVTSITASTTIGSGGSAGKEGPIVQIGAAIGSTVGQLFGVSSERLRILVGTGAAAGLAAVFNAPVTGVLFAIEVILADFSISAFSPIIFATVISTTVSHYLIGTTPAESTAVYYLESFYEYPLYILMGLVGGFIAVYFTKILYGVEEFFEKMKSVPPYVKPVIGGLLTGVIALYFPYIYGFDDMAVHKSLELIPHSVLILAVLFILKILATSFSLGSGGTGGLFTPSIFIGATFGAFFGSCANIIFPGVTASPTAYALVGMGIIVAGTTHAPITALLLVFEITSDYQVILPLMLGTIIATVTARTIMRENIYTKSLALSGDYIFKGRNLTLLQSIPITQHIQKKYESIPKEMPFTQILKLMKKSDQSTFPVVNKDQQIIGVIALRDLRPYMFEDDLYPLLIASDVMREEFLKVTPTQSLADVLRLFDLNDAEMIPVVSRRNSRKIIGVIFKDDLMRWYQKAPLFQKELG